MDTYRIPSEETRKNRKLFYNLHRERDESIKSWLDRVQSRSNYCDFMKFTNFLVIDKFTCELKYNEKRLIENSNTWSLEQLKKYLFNQKIHTESMRANVEAEQKINQNENAPIAIVKCESVSFFPKSDLAFYPFFQHLFSNQFI